MTKQPDYVLLEGKKRETSKKIGAAHETGRHAWRPLRAMTAPAALVDRDIHVFDGHSVRARRCA